VKGSLCYTTHGSSNGVSAASAVAIVGAVQSGLIPSAITCAVPGTAQTARLPACRAESTVRHIVSAATSAHPSGIRPKQRSGELISGGSCGVHPAIVKGVEAAACGAASSSTTSSRAHSRRSAVSLSRPARHRATASAHDTRRGAAAQVPCNMYSDANVAAERGSSLGSGDAVQCRAAVSCVAAVKSPVAGAGFGAAAVDGSRVFS
jgi:hypothetical protein